MLIEEELETMDVGPIGKVDEPIESYATPTLACQKEIYKRQNRGEMVMMRSRNSI